MLLVAGCGGGSSSSFQPEPVTSPSPAPAPAAAPAPAPVFSTCETKGRYASGSYVFSNNIWGVIPSWDPVPGYSQCADVRGQGDSLAVDLTWNFAEGKGLVKTFPHLSIGWDGDISRTTSAQFPLRLSPARSVMVDFSIAGVTTGTYNAAFDIWLSSSTQPSPSTYSHEILLYLHGRDTFPAGSPVATVTIGGHEFDFYDRPSDLGAWRFIVFYPKAPIISGRFDLSQFFDFMVSRGVMTRANTYLATVQLGYEIVDGRSTGSIGAFKLTLP